MAVTAADILDQAANDLNDSAHAYWTEDELLAYLNDGQRAAVLLKPEVNPDVMDLMLVSGSRQTLNKTETEEVYLLLDINCFKDADDGDPQGIITPVERKDLDNITPRWRQVDSSMTMPPENLQGNFVYDVRNRNTFYLYPSYSDWNGWHVEIVYAKTPQDITSFSGNLTLDDIYAPALLAYVMHRARAKDVSIEGQSAQLSSLFFQKFTALINGDPMKEREIIIRAEQIEE